MNDLNQAIDSVIGKSNYPKIKELGDEFRPFVDQAKQWHENALSLTVSSVEEVDKMQEAKKARLALRSVRVAIDKKRKELKAESLETGRAIDGIAKALTALIEPSENHLKHQEEYKERVEKERLDRLEAERIEKVKGLLPGEDLSFYNLREMDEDGFNKLFFMLENQAKVNAQREQEEAERIREEEARLKEAREKDLEIEKLKAQLAESQKKENELKDTPALPVDTVTQNLETIKGFFPEGQIPEIDPKTREDRERVNHISKRFLSVSEIIAWTLPLSIDTLERLEELSLEALELAREL